MRILSFLVLTLVLNTTCFAYTVILKSGKRVQGRLIGEDRSTIQLKDQNGIVLSFKKIFLDEPAMAIANNQTKFISADSQKQGSEPRSVRVYKKEDLSKMPDLSVAEGDSIESSYEESEVAQDTFTVRSDSKEQRHWQSRAISLKKDLAKLREKKIQVEASCAQARQSSSSGLTKSHRKPINMLPLLSKPAACDLLDEVTRQLEEAQERWDIFETEARRSEIPWQWLE
jgi:hypothetical protein